MNSIKEYGGFLPLELNPGTEWFSEYERNMLRYNSVKAAISKVISVKRPKCVYVPYYYCPSTIAAIERLVSNVKYYHINENMLPESKLDEEDSMIVLVDYFGVCEKKVKKEQEKYSKATILLDCAHSFFSKPLLRENVFCVYSAKKFIGVPDGAYLVGSEIVGETQQYSDSEQYAGYLIKSYEKGTNAAYSDKKDADRIISEAYLPMSILSKGLLENADYERIRTARESNYYQLYISLKNINNLVIPSKVSAYQFPLLLTEKGKHVKDELVKRKIYVPTLWNGERLQKEGNAFELAMSEHSIFLPIDQRYSKADMTHIAGTVFELLNI